MEKRYRTQTLLIVSICVLIIPSAFSQCLQNVRGNYILNGKTTAQFAIDTCCGWTEGDYYIRYVVDTGAADSAYANGVMDTVNCSLSYVPDWYDQSGATFREESSVTFSAGYNTIYAKYWVEDVPMQTVAWGPVTDIYTRGAPTGINDIADEMKLKSWPNPVGQYLHYTVNCNAEEVSIKVFDIMGKCVYRSTIKASEFGAEQNINMQAYASGIYMLQIANGKYLENTKFIKK